MAGWVTQGAGEQFQSMMAALSMATIAALVNGLGIPTVVMTYWNPVERYGVERFAADLANAGGAGLITPDLTPDSGAEWIAAADKHGVLHVRQVVNWFDQGEQEVIGLKLRDGTYAMEAAPLADGWRDRVLLHQVHPLLLHAVLFGGSYAAQTLQAARRYV